MDRRTCSPLGLAFCIVASAGIAYAQSLPAPLAGAAGASFYSGGIGADEARLIKSDAKNHRLALEFLETQGNAVVYSAGEQVIITDDRGRIIVNALSDGPLMMVDLAPGTYHISAANDGRIQRRTVEISRAAHVRLAFQWGAGRP